MAEATTYKTQMRKFKITLKDLGEALEESEPAMSIILDFARVLRVWNHIKDNILKYDSEDVEIGSLKDELKKRGITITQLSKDLEEPVPVLSIILDHVRVMRVWKYTQSKLDAYEEAFKKINK